MKYKLLFVVLLSALIWVVVLAPAHIMVRLLPAHTPLVLQGITGRIWAGAVLQAGLVDDDGLLAQGRLDWRVRPLSLLRLSPCVDFSIDYDAAQASGASASVGVVAGLACVSSDGTVSMRDVIFDLPADIFLRSPDLRLGGEISGQLTTLEWRSGLLLDLKGEGLWTDARILSDQLTMSLQTLPFNFRRESDASLVLHLDNSDLLTQHQDIPLHISLQSTVSFGGDFFTRAQLKTQPQTPDDVAELLNVLAEPTGPGEFTLELRSQNI
ncbi:MAG: type II secretion system protein N [Pseudohongiella sp.]|uniref:type II secretion system protein N n=1 Tax=Pseudohongiella sp. TaxID=1979412 RepID=UPI0034A05940